MVARFKAFVCGHAPGENVISNPAGEWMFAASVVCCKVDVPAKS
jgi:hypothetical protein